MKNSANTSLAGMPTAGGYGRYQSGTPGGPMLAPQPVHVQGVSTTNQLFLQRRSLLEAYIYCALFGLFGMHHFYLKRPFLGWMYLFSLGLLGFGWIVDLIRLPWLVKEANREEEEAAINGYCVARQRTYRFYDLRERSVLEAYIIWFPMGIFGWHQFYLGRRGFGLTYSCTAGLAGIGWLTDVFRIPSLVRESNEKICRIRNGEVVKETKECSLADAYQMAFPFGFLGLHHFFMGRIGQGLAYLCTGGLLGVGWLADLVRMPCLVSRHNREVQENRTWMRHLDDAYIYAFPFGILGFHRFYLSGPAIGLLYFCTAGLFLIGWLVDLVRMPFLVQAANEKSEMNPQMFGNSEQVYVFRPPQPSPHPPPQAQIPRQYGATNQQFSPQRPYPTPQGNVTFLTYNQPNNPYGQNFVVPVPTNPMPSICVGPPANPHPNGGPPPPNPPQYVDVAGPQPSALPPPYQETSDTSQTSASAPSTEFKPGESHI